MIGEVFSHLALYLRLISYPVAAFGVVMLMMARDDWKHRPPSLFYLSLALLLTMQWVTVLFRIVGGAGAVSQASDSLITPALVLFAAATWGMATWSARLWRRQPDKEL